MARCTTAGDVDRVGSGAVPGALGLAAASAAPAVGVEPADAGDGDPAPPALAWVPFVPAVRIPPAVGVCVWVGTVRGGAGEVDLASGASRFRVLSAEAPVAASSAPAVSTPGQSVVPGGKTSVLLPVSTRTVMVPAPQVGEGRHRQTNVYPSFKTWVHAPCVEGEMLRPRTRLPALLTTSTWMSPEVPTSAPYRVMTSSTTPLP